MDIDILPILAPYIDGCQYVIMTTIAEPIRSCCPPVLDAVLTEQQAAELAAGFKVLADAARLRLLSLIAARPDAEACTCDLIEPLGLTQPTVTHHLKVLTAAGLLTKQRRGAFTYYRVAPERLAVLAEALGC